MVGRTGAFGIFVLRPDGNTTWTTEVQIRRIIFKRILKMWDGEAYH
jgi:hypothetical protein